MRTFFITVAAIGMSTAALAQMEAPTFAAVDVDMSGGVSLAEAQAVWPELTQEAFTVADTSADGMLDQAEFDTYMATLPAM